MAKEKSQAHVDDVEAGQGELVKVQANYDLREDSITLWGVGFTAVDGVYVANVPEDLAKSMIEANRVTKL